MSYHLGLGDNYIETTGKKSWQAELFRGVLKASQNFVKLGKLSIGQLNLYI